MNLCNIEEMTIMTLIQGKKGDKLFIKDIRERELDSRLLSLGLCRGTNLSLKILLMEIFS